MRKDPPLNLSGFLIVVVGSHIIRERTPGLGSDEIGFFEPESFKVAWRVSQHMIAMPGMNEGHDRTQDEKVRHDQDVLSLMATSRLQQGRDRAIIDFALALKSVGVSPTVLKASVDLSRNDRGEIDIMLFRVELTNMVFQTTELSVDLPTDFSEVAVISDRHTGSHHGCDTESGLLRPRIGRTDDEIDLFVFDPPTVFESLLDADFGQDVVLDVDGDFLASRSGVDIGIDIGQ